MAATYGSAIYGEAVYGSSGKVLTPADAATLGFADVALTATLQSNTKVLLSWKNPTSAHFKRLIVRSPLGYPPDPNSPQSVTLVAVNATDTTDPNTNVTSFVDTVPPGTEVFYTMFVLVAPESRTTVSVAGTNTPGGDTGGTVDTGGTTGGGTPGGGVVTPPPDPGYVPQTVTGTAALSSQARIVAVGSTSTPAIGGLTYWYQNPNSEPTGAGVTVYTGTGSLGAAMAAVPAGGTLVLKFSSIITENINIALKNNVTIMNANGYYPWLNGQFRISGGENFRIWGLNIKWTSPNTNAHMIYLDGGSGEFAYSEVTMQGNSQGCYTLIRPGQTLHDWRIHHCWIHDNPGVTAHDGNQDHGLYCSAENLTQNGTIDHCLIENMPRGRNIKIGGPSGGGGAIGDIEIDHNTLYTGYGPSNGQVSNGTTNTTWSYNLLIDSGASTALTNGSGSGTGNVYHHNKADRPVGPGVTNFADGGSNVSNVSLVTLSDYAAQGLLGYGHLSA